MLKFGLLTAAAFTLVACAMTPLVPGASREETVARYGTPGRVVPLPGGGTRLQYSNQPLGSNAFMVDLDANGKFVSGREVLNPSGFARVMPGQWTRADAEREFGRPASVDRVSNWSGDILTYRWRDADQPMYFWIYLDPQNVVQKAMQGMEFLGLTNDN